ncbi:MAG: glycosyltransferase [Trueperaceae bacterium]|nr:glycosyltransferase [Trueperaceae bacterium]
MADARTCAVLIPAYNEASTVAAVVRIALDAAIGPVVVVDDGSTDDTAEVASRSGAEVLRLEGNRGKGGALAAGAAARMEDVLVLLDADLTGLTPRHVRDLVAPVRDEETDMARGVFEGGRWSTTTAQRIAPQLAGQRAVLRHLLLEVPGLADSRYGVEVAITEHAHRTLWRTCDVSLDGVSQVTKEEKHGLVRGVVVRVRMYLEIVRQLLRGKRGGGEPGSPNGL